MVVISWEEFALHCKELAENIKKDLSENIAFIYGIPRGGLPIAVYLSHLLELPLVLEPSDNALIVDDIADSGTTLQPFHERGAVIATLYRKDSTKVEPNYYAKTINDWIFLPYETLKTSKLDREEKK